MALLYVCFVLAAFVANTSAHLPIPLPHATGFGVKGKIGGDADVKVVETDEVSLPFPFAISRA